MGYLTCDACSQLNQLQLTSEILKIFLDKFFLLVGFIGALVFNNRVVIPASKLKDAIARTHVLLNQYGNVYSYPYPSESSPSQKTLYYFKKHDLRADDAEMLFRDCGSNLLTYTELIAWFRVAKFLYKFPNISEIKDAGSNLFGVANSVASDEQSMKNRRAHSEKVRNCLHLPEYN